jgi:hypothetical protein
MEARGVEHALPTIARSTALQLQATHAKSNIRAGGVLGTSGMRMRGSARLGEIVRYSYDSAEIFAYSTDSEGAADSARRPLYSIGWRAEKKNIHFVHRHEQESAWVRRARAVCWPVLQPCPRCSMQDCLIVFEKRGRSQLLLLPTDRCCSSASRAFPCCSKQCHAVQSTRGLWCMSVACQTSAVHGNMHMQ